MTPKSDGQTPPHSSEALRLSNHTPQNAAQGTCRRTIATCVPTSDANTVTQRSPSAGMTPQHMGNLYHSAKAIEQSTTESPICLHHHDVALFGSACAPAETREEGTGTSSGIDVITATPTLLVIHLDAELRGNGDDACHNGHCRISGKCLTNRCAGANCNTNGDAYPHYHSDSHSASNGNATPHRNTDSHSYANAYSD